MRTELIINNNNLRELEIISLNEAFNSFLEYYKSKKPTTIKAYSKNLRTLGAWLKDNFIDHLPTRKDIIEFRDYLKATNHKATTINSYLNTIRQLTKWLTSEGLYNKNPYDNIDGAKLSRDFRKDALTIEQVKELLDQFKRDTPKSKRDFAIISILVIGGLRTIELERALIGDIDQEKSILYVLGKGRDEKNEYIKLPQYVLKAINDYLETRQDRENPEAPLFTSESNFTANKEIKALPKESISRIVKTALREIGLNSSRLTAHSLRHTTATLNLKNGGTLEETRELLRHSSINTTMIYAHIIEREKNQSEQRIANLIFTGKEEA